MIIFTFKHKNQKLRGSVGVVAYHSYFLFLCLNFLGFLSIWCFLSLTLPFFLFCSPSKKKNGYFEFFWLRVPISIFFICRLSLKVKALIPEVVGTRNKVWERKLSVLL